MADYDWPAIERRRADGETWPEIAEDYGVTPGTIRKAYSRYTGGASDAPQQRRGVARCEMDGAVFFVRVTRVK